MDKFQERRDKKIPQSAHSLAVLQWQFNLLNWPWVMSSGKRLQTEATQTWAFTPSRVKMRLKGFRVWAWLLSDHCARWTCLIRTTWLVYSEVNMIANLFSSVHTLFAFSYRDCLLLAGPSHFQSNKNTVQRPQRHWPCTKWKVESSCWQANYRPLSWSTPWTL